MLGKILPVLLVIIASATGIGAGKFLRPSPELIVASNPKDDADALETAKPQKAAKAPEEGDEVVDYVKLNNQFVVPIVKGKRVASLIVLSLSLEVPETQRSEVFRHEPKLRNSFLQVLFDHANVGGFDGAFTQTENLNVLRKALVEIGQRDIGRETVKDVLITEIARQDY